MFDVTKFEGHTPGPWEVYRYTRDPVGMSRVRAWLGVDYAGREKIVEVPVSAADSELLAAAPELLAEVKRLRERVKELEQQIAQQSNCDHKDSVVIREGIMTGTVMCKKCGHSREWNAY